MLSHTGPDSAYHYECSHHSEQFDGKVLEDGIEKRHVENCGCGLVDLEFLENALVLRTSRGTEREKVVTAA